MTTLLVTLGATVLAGSGPVQKLHQLRADKRAAMREASLSAKADSAAAIFGLLVIPVDFSDERLPTDWDPQTTLSPHLFPLTAESLANFYRITSRGHLELRILLTPLVSLPDRRVDYSDVGRIGFHNTRKLATEAILAARDMGLDFRLLDMEGPDRKPGSSDDDGELDGVLILHAAVGQENDPENGLIQALQFYLDEPITDRGVIASSYAVASMRSGLGIWAHEVGHLFGLEDRYDLQLAAAEGDFMSRGGLGRFSLMASGAWGRGDGSGAALLDAYSAAQLGWVDLVSYRGTIGADSLSHTLVGGEAWRVWTQGRHGTEYFLMETRGGSLAAPFDVEVPVGQLLIYHVDENLAAGEASAPSFPERHIRVALVEADGDDQLRRGEDRGRPEDLFPGPLQVTEWTDSSFPASNGYLGPSEVALTQITSSSAGVVMEFSDAASYGFSVELSREEGVPLLLRLVVQETGLPAAHLSARISISSAPAFGSFAGGETAVTVQLQHVGGGRWEAISDPEWIADPDLPPTAETTLHIRLFNDDQELDQVERPLLWRQESDPLAFADNWPADWLVEWPSDQLHTTWHRWEGSPALTADGSPVLVCTGSNYTSPADWPDARYGNTADVILTSGPLPQGATAVRIVHALDTEVSRPGSAWDAGLVEIGLADGTWLEAEPLAGYGAKVSAWTRTPLHGRPAFAGNDSLTEGGVYAWRVDLVVLPDAEGPLRMRLRFTSDEIYTHRGWVIARLESVSEFPGGNAFPVAILNEMGGSNPVLAWDWPWEPASSFAVEISPDQGLSWTTVWEGWPTGGSGDYPWSVDLDTLGGGISVRPDERQVIRVLARVDFGQVASQPVVLYRDGGTGPALLLGSPYPNPAHGPVRFLLQIPVGQAADLSLYDLRGRRLREWRLPGGQQLLEWDGKDAFGRRAAAGLYFLRLQSGQQTVTRKVVFIK